MPCSGSTCELAHKTHTQSVGIHSHTRGQSHRHTTHSHTHTLSHTHTHTHTHEQTHTHAQKHTRGHSHRHKHTTHTHGHSLHRQLVHACLQLLSLPPGLQLHLRHQRAHQALHIIEVSLVRSGRYHTCFRNDSCHCSSIFVMSARTKPSTSSRSAWSDQVDITHVFVMIRVIAAPPPSSAHVPSPPHH